MTRDKVEKDIPQLLEDHKRYLQGWYGGAVASDFTGLDLRGENLRGVDLSCATLVGVDMRGMDLTCTRMSHANLRLARLGGACLLWADLSNADLTDASLRGANLQGVSMRGASLRHANLQGSALTGAYVVDCNLSHTKLPPDFRVASLCFGGYPITVTPTYTAIGCQTRPNESWLSFEIGDPRIETMAPYAAKWWARHRESVCAVIRDVMQPLDTPEVSK